MRPENVLRLCVWHAVLTGVGYQRKAKAVTESSWPESVQVQCYSGRTYAERPASFVWRDKRYEVKEVEKEWLEPGERHFIVKTTGEKGEKDEKRFQICYHEREDSWSLTEL